MFSAASLGRIGIGVEISPVGWVYGKAKLNPATYIEVETRLLSILDVVSEFADEARKMPKFFIKCFAPGVRRFLLAARKLLDWRNNDCDRTLMALLLIYLHGKKGQALSNQMRQTKSFSPQYALKWWKEKEMLPPIINAKEFLLSRIQWRYAKGTIQKDNSEIFLDNSVIRLPKICTWLTEQKLKKPRLLLTSPPYFAVTNYHYDQWLGLWLLGFEQEPYVSRGPFQRRFSNPNDYKALLRDVFYYSASIVSNDAVVYVRTSKDTFTHDVTLEALKEMFPDKRVREFVQPFLKPTQTHLFGDKSPKIGEVDIVLTPVSKVAVSV